MSTSPRRWLWVAWPILTALLAIVVGLPFLPRLLIAGPAEVPSDVLIHSGGERTSIEHAAALYRDGVIGKILCASQPIAGGIYPAEVAQRRLLALGIPARDVILLRLQPAACGGANEAALLREIRRHGWTSVLANVDPILSGSSLAALRRRLEPAGVRVHVTYPRGLETRFLDAWWRDEMKVQQVILVSLSRVLDTIYPECWSSGSIAHGAKS